MREKPKYRMGNGEKVFLSVMIGMPLIGILSAVAIPAILNQRNKVKVASEVPTQVQGPTGQAPSAENVTPPSPQLVPTPSQNEAQNGSGHGSESLQELGLAADLVPVVPITSLVEVLPRPELVYPAVAKEARVQGAVLVEVTISASGYPISAVAQNGPVVLREVAEQWQMKRKFQPPVVQGQNKPVKVMNSVNFTIAETPGAQAPTSKTTVASSVQPVAQPNQTLGDQQPKVLTQAPATFPRQARQMRWEINLDHKVDLKVFVGEQGQPLKVSVLGGIGFGFDEAAIEAANKSTYAPAMRNGQPTRGWVDMKVVVPKISQ